MPCNGLIYTPPHDCACFLGSLLNGFCALAPESKMPSLNTAMEEPRLVRGPAYEQIFPSQAALPDPCEWPTYRHDPARSGVAGSGVPSELQAVWQAALHGRLSAPTVAAGKVFVAESDAHTLHALDARSGNRQWQFTADGRIDSPPTVYAGRVLFGSADGWVYSLRAADGKLAWR